ncbi:OLC1v1035114C1 [Oldenlandia corymbosa var. corymbosa]|uniref:OLC1v1035114C1 n=1 Tax=Oldenlandia corymbosa var. corymbosa TaxID=529605 RepID=A0AAV1CTJ2_OLDCO|nr:OLC1v1035114C1 [Oldenlandia corymbosa var. corymbosa]
MESLLIGSSLAKPSFLPKINPAGSVGLCSSSSSSSSGVHLSTDEKLKDQLIVSKRKLWRYQNVRTNNNEKFVTQARKGSDNHLVNAILSQPFDESQCLSNTLLESLQGQIELFFRFSRLYAFIGTGLSIISISAMVAKSISDISPAFLIGMSQAFGAAFFMHIYMNGLNQLSDIEIDKVNKPYLPLVSGEYSINTGFAITLCSVLMSFLIVWIGGSWTLLCGLLSVFISGTVYSINVPFLRWKNSAFLAALCIFSMRVPPYIAFYLHMQTFVLQRPALISKPLILGSLFLSLFSVVVAFSKDIPDVEGDELHGVQSFAVQFGKKKAFWICIALLQIAYLIAISIGLTSSQDWSKLIMVAGHTILALIVWSHSKTIDLGSKASTSSFYQFIWKLLYVESFLIPLLR